MGTKNKTFFLFAIFSLISLGRGENYIPLCDEDIEVELWGECYNIETTINLSFDSNNLIGVIPSSISNLENLTFLSFRNNQLFGEIPPGISNLQNLSALYLSMNQLTGEIPQGIWESANLTELHLNHNLFEGEIPIEIGNLTDLNNLDLSANQLSGLIPEEICNQGDNSPNLGGNQLCPPYPDCLTEDDVGYQDTSGCEGLSNSDVYPFEYSLNKPYPNPFNPSTTISFSVPSFEKVSINVYDIKGSLVAALVDDYYHSGNHTINWDGSSYSSDNYIVKMKSSNYESSQIITLVK